MLPILPPGGVQKKGKGPAPRYRVGLAKFIGMDHESLVKTSTNTFSSLFAGHMHKRDFSLASTSTVPDSAFNSDMLTFLLVQSVAADKESNLLTLPSKLTTAENIQRNGVAHIPTDCSQFRCAEGVNCEFSAFCKRRKHPLNPNGEKCGMGFQYEDEFRLNKKPARVCIMCLLSRINKLVEAQIYLTGPKSATINPIHVNRGSPNCIDDEYLISSPVLHGCVPRYSEADLCVASFDPATGKIEELTKDAIQKGLEPGVIFTWKYFQRGSRVKSVGVIRPEFHVIEKMRVSILSEYFTITETRPKIKTGKENKDDNDHTSQSSRARNTSTEAFPTLRNRIPLLPHQYRNGTNDTSSTGHIWWAGEFEEALSYVFSRGFPACDLAGEASEVLYCVILCPVITLCEKRKTMSGEQEARYNHVFEKCDLKNTGDIFSDDIVYKNHPPVTNPEACRLHSFYWVCMAMNLCLKTCLRFSQDNFMRRDMLLLRCQAFVPLLESLLAWQKASGNMDTVPTDDEMEEFWCLAYADGDSELFENTSIRCKSGHLIPVDLHPDYQDLPQIWDPATLPKFFPTFVRQYLPEHLLNDGPWSKDHLFHELTLKNMIIHTHLANTSMKFEDNADNGTGNFKWIMDVDAILTEAQLPDLTMELTLALGSDNHIDCADFTRVHFKKNAPDDFMESMNYHAEMEEREKHEMQMEIKKEKEEIKRHNCGQPSTSFDPMVKNEEYEYEEGMDTIEEEEVSEEEEGEGKREGREEGEENNGGDLYSGIKSWTDSDLSASTRPHKHGCLLFEMLFIVLSSSSKTLTHPKFFQKNMPLLCLNLVRCLVVGGFACQRFVGLKEKVVAFVHTHFSQQNISKVLETFPSLILTSLWLYAEALLNNQPSLWCALEGKYGDPRNFGSDTIHPLAARVASFSGEWKELVDIERAAQSIFWKQTPYFSKIHNAPDLMLQTCSAICSSILGSPNFARERAKEEKGIYGACELFLPTIYKAGEIYSVFLKKTAYDLLLQPLGVILNGNEDPSGRTIEEVYSAIVQDGSGSQKMMSTLDLISYCQRAVLFELEVEALVGLVGVMKLLCIPDRLVSMVVSLWKVIWFCGDERERTFNKKKWALALAQVTIIDERIHQHIDNGVITYQDVLKMRLLFEFLAFEHDICEVSLGNQNWENNQRGDYSDRDQCGWVTRLVFERDVPSRPVDLYVSANGEVVSGRVYTRGTKRAEEINDRLMSKVERGQGKPSIERPLDNLPKLPLKTIKMPGKMVVFRKSFIFRGHSSVDIDAADSIILMYHNRLQEVISRLTKDKASDSVDTLIGCLAAPELIPELRNSKIKASLPSMIDSVTSLMLCTDCGSLRNFSSRLRGPWYGLLCDLCPNLWRKVLSYPSCYCCHETILTTQSSPTTYMPGELTPQMFRSGDKIVVDSPLQEPTSKKRHRQKKDGRRNVRRTTMVSKGLRAFMKEKGLAFSKKYKLGNKKTQRQANHWSTPTGFSEIGFSLNITDDVTGENHLFFVCSNCASNPDIALLKNLEILLTTTILETGAENPETLRAIINELEDKFKV